MGQEKSRLGNSMILVFIVAGVAIGIILVLSEHRSYKVIEEKLHVRHGIFGKWKEVEQHLREDHKEDQNIYR
jgi:membrane protein YdbS with pleckstrin-like domain